MEPPERWFCGVPCVWLRPEKLCLFITPANPFPFDLEVTSVMSPGWKIFALISVPGLISTSGFNRSNSFICLIGFTANFEKYVNSDFFNDDGLTSR